MKPRKLHRLRVKQRKRRENARKQKLLRNQNQRAEVAEATRESLRNQVARKIPHLHRHLREAARAQILRATHASSSVIHMFPAEQVLQTVRIVQDLYFPFTRRLEYLFPEHHGSRAIMEEKSHIPKHSREMLFTTADMSEYI